MSIIEVESDLKVDEAKPWAKALTGFDPGGEKGGAFAFLGSWLIVSKHESPLMSFGVKGTTRWTCVGINGNNADFSRISLFFVEQPGERRVTVSFPEASLDLSLDGCRLGLGATEGHVCYGDSVTPRDSFVDSFFPDTDKTTRTRMYNPHYLAGYYACMYLGLPLKHSMTPDQKFAHAQAAEKAGLDHGSGARAAELNTTCPLPDGVKWLGTINGVWMVLSPGNRQHLLAGLAASWLSNDTLPHPAPALHDILREQEEALRSAAQVVSVLAEIVQALKAKE